MIEDLKNKFQELMAKVGNKKTLADLELKFLGRKGEINNLLKEIKTLAAEEKVVAGKLINDFKKEIEQEIIIKKKDLLAVGQRLIKKIDVTAPGAKVVSGHLHPRTQVLRKIEEIFISLGFSVVEGPELETQWYNFEALNIPKDHPARDMQDTFYVKNPTDPASRGKREDLVLRTHTSPNQVRFMEKNNPPLRIIVPGKVFRNEATDATHDFQFYQVEGLMVDKTISVANFKAIMEEFFKRLYGSGAKIRLRPSYFPFTEPSFEVDLSCVFCQSSPDKRKGCRLCSGTGWIEIAGAGMVNQFVFEQAGYVRNEWQGFAFGIGFERIVMAKHKINDIRLFSSGDMRFLKQF